MLLRTGFAEVRQEPSPSKQLGLANHLLGDTIPDGAWVLPRLPVVQGMAISKSRSYPIFVDLSIEESEST